MIYNPELFPREENAVEIREWWHSILREQNAYPSYAFFLVSSSDKDAIEYLSKYATELDQMSGKDCLVLALNKNKFKRSGFDQDTRTIGTLRSNERKLDLKYWRALVKDLMSQGYSVQIANYFKIPYSAFPCLIIFQDIRSSEHIVISLSKMSIDEIAERMKTIFSVIHNASAEKKSVLGELEKLRVKEAFQNGSKKLITTVSHVGEKTFEIAMEAWVKSLIP